MEKVFQLGIFLTGDSLVRLIYSFGYMLLLGIMVLILLLLLVKIATEN